MNSKELLIWQCGECGQAYKEQKYADECCIKTYPEEHECHECGKKITYILDLCDSCLSKKRYEEAVKISIEKYMKLYEGFPIELNGDILYFDNSIKRFEEILKKYNKPYAYGTQRKLIGFDKDTEIERLRDAVSAETYFESLSTGLDFSEKAYEEYTEFMENWNKKYGLYYYEGSGLIILSSKES